MAAIVSFIHPPIGNPLERQESAFDTPEMSPRPLSPPQHQLSPRRSVAQIELEIMEVDDLPASKSPETCSPEGAVTATHLEDPPKPKQVSPAPPETTITVPDPPASPPSSPPAGRDGSESPATQIRRRTQRWGRTMLCVMVLLVVGVLGLVLVFVILAATSPPPAQVIMLSARGGDLKLREGALGGQLLQQRP